MENVSAWVIDKNKEHYSRCKDKAEKTYDVLRHIQLYMSKYNKMKICNPFCQTHSQKWISKTWTNIQEVSG